jgi:hypothetical protein
MRAPLLLLALVVTLSPSRAFAADDAALPLVHPIYAQLPDLPETEVTKHAFATAAARYKLGPLEVIDVPGVVPPRAPGALKDAVARAAKIAFDEALPALEAVANEVEATGGAGLSTAQLSDLYLYRAMATARADWNAPAAPEPDAANPARARAFADYTRAAVLTPTRALNPRELPPQVVADFGRAVEAARKLPRGTLLVRGDAEAGVRLDGAEPTPVAGGITFRDVTHGEHLLAVEELGRLPWGTQLTLTGESLVQTIPNRASLSLSDAKAAEHARRMGARFALVAERKPGAGARVELRHIDLTGAKRDGAFISTTGDEKGSLDAAVMRLDEQARKLRQLELAAGTAPELAPTPPPAGTPAPVLVAPPAKAKFSDSPGLWARDHWPLLTAVGVFVGAAIVLGVAAGN